MATFTPTRTQHPDELWQPHRPTATSRGGSQGDPFNFRPGRSIEHEPVDRSERDSEHVAKAASHVVAGQQIRAALRGGM